MVITCTCMDALAVLTIFLEESMIRGAAAIRLASHPSICNYALMTMSFLGCDAIVVMRMMIVDIASGR